MKNNWYRTILLLLTFIIGFPSLFAIFSFIDDGQSIWVSQKITSAILSGDILAFAKQISEPSLGRFRPLYWLFQWFIYLIGDKNHYLHHCLRLTVFLTVVFLLFEIVKKITDSSRKAFFAGLFFVVNILNIENWYRLGPAEPFLVLLQLSSVYLLLSQKKLSFYLSCFLVASSYFLKENQIVFIPLTFLLWLLLSFLERKPNRRINFKNRYLVFFLVNLFFGTLVRLITMKFGVPEGSNASFYQINFQRVIVNTMMYLRMAMGDFEPLLSIAALSFITTLFFAIKEKKIFEKIILWQLFFLVWFFSFILVQSPWLYVLPRYFLPAMIGLTAFLGIQYSLLFDFLKKILTDKKIPGDMKLFLQFLKGAILFSFIVVFTYNGIAIFNYIKNYPNNFDEQMLDFLNKNASPGKTIFINFVKGDANLELYYEIPLHFKLFYGREDLIFDHLDFSEVDKFNKGDLILSGNGVPAYTEEKIATYSGVLLIKHLRRGFFSLITTKPIYLIKKLFFLQNPFRGLYTVTHNYYNWYIYQFQ